MTQFEEEFCAIAKTIEETRRLTAHVIGITEQVAVALVGLVAASKAVLPAHAQYAKPKLVAAIAQAEAALVAVRAKLPP